MTIEKCELGIIFTYYINIYIIRKYEKSWKMNFIFIIVIIFILTISFFNYLIYRQKRDSYIKAGKKWDGIVKELRRRK